MYIKSVFRRSIQRFRTVFYIMSLGSLLFVFNCQLRLTDDPSNATLNYLSSSEFNAVSDFSSERNDRVIGNEPSVSYTNYTINHLGLRPLDPLRYKALEPKYGAVINDVLSFKYPINVREDDSLCHQWQNRMLMNDSERTVLLVVVSAATNLEKRALIRRTWAKRPKLKKSKWLSVIFLIGLPSNEDEEYQDTQILIQKESSTHGDLVQVNVVDSYKNLTLKSVAMLHWAHSNCASAQLVIKCDDDNYVNYDTLARIAPYLNDTNSIYGTSVSTLRPARSKRHKHYISRQAWPWPRYPFYLMGGSYALAGQIIHRMLAAAQTTPLFPFEDVYMMALCAPKANVRLKTKPAYYQPNFPGFSGLDACFVQDSAVWQTLTTFEFLRSHRVANRVYKQNLTCKYSNKKKKKCFFLGVFC